jgi:hypothetical protein
VVVARADAVMGGEQLAAYIDAGGRAASGGARWDPTLGGACPW